MKAREVYEKLCVLAPIELSAAMCAADNCSDNSGLLLETDYEISGILFSLDLTSGALAAARERGFNMIVTHHPTPFYPIKSLKYSDVFTRCALTGTAVCAMHLNLDAAEGGIDASLAEALGAGECEILTPFGDGSGYGRVFETSEQSLEEFAEHAKSMLSTDTAVCYGSGKVKRVASFCGAGLDFEQLAQAFDADTLVSADIRHHILVAALEKGKNVVQLTHYASENYGFKKFYERSKTLLTHVISDFYENNNMR